MMEGKVWQAVGRENSGGEEIARSRYLHIYGVLNYVEEERSKKIKRRQTTKECWLGERARKEEEVSSIVRSREWDITSGGRKE